MKNLYLFNDNDSAASYGIGAYLNELINALESTTIHVHVIHLHSTRSKFEIVRSNSIENWYIPEIRNNNTFSGLLWKVENYCQNVIFLLRLYIKDRKNLIFHFNFNQYQFLCKELKKVFDCKTVVTVHFMKWSLELHGNLRRLHAIRKKNDSKRNSIHQLIYLTDEYESLLYKEADRIITFSQNMKNIICNIYPIEPNKVYIIPNGVKDIEKDNEINEIRKKWIISEKESLILFVGRLHQVKGLVFLIRAFHKVLNKKKDCRLIIAGSGDYSSYIQESKKSCTKITFTGLLEKEVLGELYKITDIGVVPSLFETFGYVAVEMMMNSIPMITTNTCGLAELTENNISSLQIPLIEKPETVEIDTDLLAEKILYLLENPNQARLIGINARNRYKGRYTLDLFRKNILAFYEKLNSNIKNNINS